MTGVQTCALPISEQERVAYSIAVSLKRIADHLEVLVPLVQSVNIQVDPNAPTDADCLRDAITDGINNALMGNSPFTAGQAFGAGMRR